MKKCPIKMKVSLRLGLFGQIRMNYYAKKGTMIKQDVNGVL